MDWWFLLKSFERAGREPGGRRADVLLSRKGAIHPGSRTSTLPGDAGMNARSGAPWSGVAEGYLLAAMSVPKLRPWWHLDHVLSLMLLEASDGDKEPFKSMGFCCSLGPFATTAPHCRSFCTQRRRVRPEKDRVMPGESQEEQEQRKGIPCLAARGATEQGQLGTAEVGAVQRSGRPLPGEFKQVKQGLGFSSGCV